MAGCSLIGRPQGHSCSL